MDFEGTIASGAERFYRRTLDKLRLKRVLESRLVHTVTLKQTECRKRNKKIAAAVYLYQVDNDGEWGEIRFDFATGTAEIGLARAGVGHDKVQYLCKDGDSAHTELHRRQSRQVRLL